MKCVKIYTTATCYSTTKFKSADLVVVVDIGVPVKLSIVTFSRKTEKIANLKMVFKKIASTQE